MSGNKRKVVLVGTGMVGMSFAYAALNQNVCDELKHENPLRRLR